MSTAIILAAGSSRRFSKKEDKLLVEVAGKPLIYYTLFAYNDHASIDKILLICSSKNRASLKSLVKKYAFQKVFKVATGGKTRQESLGLALQELEKIGPEKEDIVLVHNGANPLPSFREISEVIEKSATVGACISGHPVASTIKEVKGGHVLKTHNRKKLFAAETPQACKYHLLKTAYEHAVKNNLEATDEAMMLEAIDQKITFVKADPDNFKVTTGADINRLKGILGDDLKDYLVGFGQDSHLFEEDKLGLSLAGLYYKDQPKLKANSDGDVILHAIFNAVSQAIGDLSLGFYADPLCAKGIKDSTRYLRPLLNKLKRKKLKLNNLGLMIEAKKPLIDPITKQLKESLSSILDLDTKKIGITATSGENAGIFGEGLGVQCYAIVSLKKS